MKKAFIIATILSVFMVSSVMALGASDRVNVRANEQNSIESLNNTTFTNSSAKVNLWFEGTKGNAALELLTWSANSRSTLNMNLDITNSYSCGNGFYYVTGISRGMFWTKGDKPIQVTENVGFWVYNGQLLYAQSYGAVPFRVRFSNPTIKVTAGLLTLWFQNFGRTDCENTNKWCSGADANKDGMVDMQDYQNIFSM